ncbi:hypothetical protein KSX_12710 [Ktedonospora formicarum]|uniref:Uncharacterized protein n=1 Tax=Ktedonospora formicarum TaxID=2778364 RepID=A0A8J3MQY5_9CHLR|nr:hypothetical protein KSX_12710 [Ktedonospora formicarum]
MYLSGALKRLEMWEEGKIFEGAALCLIALDYAAPFWRRFATMSVYILNMTSAKLLFKRKPER